MDILLSLYVYQLIFVFQNVFFFDDFPLKEIKEEYQQSKTKGDKLYLIILLIVFILTPFDCILYLILTFLDEN